MTGRAPRIVARRSAFEGWNKLDILTVEAEDLKGKIRRHEREVVDHGEASVVLAIDRDRGVAVLARQWRAPLVALGRDPFLLEACAGILDPGETPEEAARREAEEEIGLKIGELRKVGTVLPSPGTLTERMHLFIAEVSAADRTRNGGGNPHEGEDIEVVEVALAELFKMALRDEIEDAKTLILVQRLMLEQLEACRPERQEREAWLTCARCAPSAGAASSG
jgi:nudix-type nucleoside diphosphatase (YffH/AdpP family)